MSDVTVASIGGFIIGLLFVVLWRIGSIYEELKKK